ncbi:hypothetical protein GWI33_008735 [Rhynchophorus ferrugineus]|uniref:Uncharacterized protein n=1 Tax=Rhynchophorus ferrugineus TaxID=354439 RepID=A0A834MDW7_RHYFE|nr:hypothetical protein GWI33_008735 [Rhynchophorus ferrugineus]
MAVVYGPHPSGGAHSQSGASKTPVLESRPTIKKCRFFFGHGSLQLFSRQVGSLSERALPVSRRRVSGHDEVISCCGDGGWPGDGRPDRGQTQTKIRGRFRVRRRGKWFVLILWSEVLSIYHAYRTH